MKKTLLILLLALAACMPKSITRFQGEVRRCSHGDVKFKSRALLMEENQHQAQTQMWDTQRLQQENNALPEHGFLSITTKNNSLEMANPKNYEIAIMQQGEMVFRTQLSDQLPRFTTGSNSYWYSVEVLPMPVNPEGGFKVFLFQTPQNLRCEVEF